MVGNSVLEVVAAFEKASGKPIPYNLVGRRDGDVPASYASCQLAESDLGWTAKHTLNDMCMQINSAVNVTHLEIFTGFLLLSGVDMWGWQSKNPFGFQKNENS